MKGDALLPLSLVKRKDRPRKSDFSVGFQQITDFRQKFFFSRWTGSRCRLLEAIYLPDHQEQAKGDDQKFDHRIDKHPISKNWYSFVGASLPGGCLRPFQ